MSAIANAPNPLLAAGLDVPAATAVGALLAQASATLGRAPACAWWVPGRIEVLGKHTDYAGGRVLNCATDLGLVVVAAPRRDGRVVMVSGGQRLDLPLAAQQSAQAGWGTYAAAVVRRLVRHFPGMDTGADIVVAANLPAAAGMSSSSALVSGLHLVLAHLNHLPGRSDYRAAIASDADLALYLACHENGSGFRQLAGDAGVGTSGGSQDHAAIVLSQAGMLNDWSFAPFRRVGTVAWPRALALTVAVSGVVAEKTAAAREHYNRVAARARAALAAWNQASGRGDASLGAAFAAAGAEAVLATMPNDDLRQRADQVAIESLEIIPGTVAALAAGDLTGFAALIARSQALAETHLGNQVPETVDLVRLALEHGAVAASAFGAGFGGAVWAAFPVADERSAAWLAAYLARHPQHAKAASRHRVHPGPGATPLHRDRPPGIVETQ